MSQNRANGSLKIHGFTLIAFFQFLSLTATIVLLDKVSSQGSFASIFEAQSSTDTFFPILVHFVPPSPFKQNLPTLGTKTNEMPYSVKTKLKMILYSINTNTNERIFLPASNINAIVQLKNMKIKSSNCGKDSVIE